MQAYIITAYTQPQLLDLTLKQIRMQNAYAFVHIDSKSSWKKYFQTKYQSDEYIHIYSLANISWGSFNHLYTICNLLEKAIHFSDISYFHIISGQDILLRSKDEFDSFFNYSNNHIYMSCTNLEKSEPICIDRFKQYILFPNSDSRKFPYRYLNSVIFLLQKKLHLTRSHIKDLCNIYKGVVWMSFPYDVAKYLCSQFYLLRFFKHVNIAEEYFFQTLIMNSEYCDNVCYNNLRYSDWTFRNGSAPAVLDSTDFHIITENIEKYFFARKIDYNLSNMLIQYFYRC